MMSDAVQKACAELARVVAFPYEPSPALLDAVEVLAESILDTVKANYVAIEDPWGNR